MKRTDKFETKVEIRNNKVVFLGDATVGKTSIIYRYIFKNFSTFTDATIGAAFKCSTVDLNGGDIVKLDIWDTAGQERYKSLVPLYYRDAKCAIIVFDLSNKETYFNALKWIEKVKSESNELKMIYLVGNKWDTIKNSLETFHNESNKILHNDVNYMEVSAKTGYNIEELFISVAENIRNPKKNELFDETQKGQILQERETANWCNCQ